MGGQIEQKVIKKDLLESLSAIWKSKNGQKNKPDSVAYKAISGNHLSMRHTRTLNRNKRPRVPTLPCSR